MFKIEPCYMKLTDRIAVNLLRERIDPATGRSDLKIKELAFALGVGTATANRIVRRLQAQGVIQRHHKQGKSGASIEVLQKD